jgi:hypothetical protein
VARVEGDEGPTKNNHHLRPHAVGFREAALWSAFFVAVAVGFGFLLASLEGWGMPGSTLRAASWRKVSRSTTCSSS